MYTHHPLAPEQEWHKQTWIPRIYTSYKQLRPLHHYSLLHIQIPRMGQSTHMHTKDRFGGFGMKKFKCGGRRSDKCLAWKMSFVLQHWAPGWPSWLEASAPHRSPRDATTHMAGMNTNVEKQELSPQSQALEEKNLTFKLHLETDWVFQGWTQIWCKFSGRVCKGYIQMLWGKGFGMSSFPQHWWMTFFFFNCCWCCCMSTSLMF